MKDKPGILVSAELMELALELHELLVTKGTAVSRLDDDKNVVAHLRNSDYGVFLLASSANSIEAHKIVNAIHDADILTEVVVLSDKADVAFAVQMMKAGVFDVLVPTVPVRKILQVLGDAISRYQEKRARRRSEERNRVLLAFEEIVGKSPSVARVRETIESVSKTDANVLIIGEPGTGKELVAKSIHSRSNRRANPFIAVNCAALPGDILEKELFGYEKGAFDGALIDKPGSFELASGGTLFLDEINSLSTENQSRLLQALEAQSFRRFGGRENINVDVRIVAASTSDVSSSLDQGGLRSDLYYRLSVVEIQLLPLRNRKADVIQIGEHFLKLFGMKYGKNIKGFTSDYVDLLQAYSWPGNVRELRNAIERAVVICPGELISILDLPEKILKTQTELMHVNIPIGASVEEAEKKLILETLASVGNNKAKAAQILGVSRRTLHNKLHSFDWRVEGK